MVRRTFTEDERSTSAGRAAVRRTVLRKIGSLALAGAVCGFGGLPPSVAAHSAEPSEKRCIHRYGGADGERNYGLTQTDDCGFALVGTTRSINSDHPAHSWLIKVDSDGTEAWDRDYAWGSFNSVLQADSGYLLGGSKRHRTGSDAWLMKTDSEGATEWSKTWGVDDESLSAVAQLTDGGFVGVGSLLVEVDDEGTKQWYRSESAKDVVATDDGGFAYVTGSALKKVNSDGAVHWAKWFRAGERDEFYAMTRTTDGGYALAGIAQPKSGDDPKTRIVRTDSDGEVQWETRFRPVSVFHDIIETADGGFVTVGGNFRFEVAKLDSDGTLRWSKQYIEADGVNGAEAVVKTKNGGYAVSGTTTVTRDEGDKDLQMVLFESNEE